ncbi:MAG: AMP-binding protein [Ectothiorhodospiraceae bacterium AqS1]|nr:AMP-binding protein [Ectothiorhodospiraceae bacterium AqS1]
MDNASTDPSPSSGSESNPAKAAPHSPDPPAEEFAEGLLLETLRSIVDELHPHIGARTTITLDSALDRDLGLDSLSRMELLSRLEKASGATIPVEAMGGAETARELLPLLRIPDPSARRSSAGESEGPSPSAADRFADPRAGDHWPPSASSLLQALDFHVRHHGDRVHVFLEGSAAPAGAENPFPVRFAELDDRVRRIAAALIERGLEPGSHVALMLPTGLDYLCAFLAVQMVQAVPVPIYPPARPNQIEDHIRRHAAILDNAAATMLITFSDILALSRLLGARVAGLKTVDIAGLIGDARFEGLPDSSPESTAFLQYTSGSTGNPKGVVLSHGDVIASLVAMGQAIEITPEDAAVSWLPLYHDMGLIGMWMGSLYYGFPLALMSPLDFLADPARWPAAIDRHRATISGGPNFAYELCVRRIDPERAKSLDLSCWRFAFNGAEPVQGRTMRRFAERFAPSSGFRAEALAPVYGLAEATLGVAIPPPGRGFKIDRVDARIFSRRKKAQPIADIEGFESSDEGSLAAGIDGADSEARSSASRVAEFVSCGPPIPGFEVRIVDERGRECEERTEGSVQFLGPSTTSGYYRNPRASAELFDGRWLRSGDRGYIAAGELYISGRDKDLIVRAGRNIYPYDLEAAVGGIEGVRKGCVAVFAAPDPRTATERLVVVAETKEGDLSTRQWIEGEIRREVADRTGSPPEEIVLAPPRSVLKTSSGKIRRSAMRELFEAGSIGRGAGSVRRQLLRLSLAAAAGYLRRQGRRLARMAYSIHVGAVATLLFVSVWPLFALSWNARARWRWGRWLLRSAFRAVGIRLRTTGGEYLREGSVVVVNHASYLDGPLLLAAMPAPITIVAKAEFTDNPLIAGLLRAFGVEFAERLDHQAGLVAVESLTSRLERKEIIGLFPEGTMHRMPGLLPFRLGAFKIAVQGRARVIPVTLSGSRSVLRDGQWIPRPGEVSFRINPPLDEIDRSPPGEDDEGREGEGEDDERAGEADRGSEAGLVAEDSHSHSPAEPSAEAQGSQWAQAVRLRDAARAVILSQCGEPDLGARHDVLGELLDSIRKQQKERQERMKGEG